MSLKLFLSHPEILFFIPTFILCKMFSIKHKECELRNTKRTAILSIFVIIVSNILITLYLIAVNKYEDTFSSINNILLIFLSLLFINIPVILALIYKKEPLSSVGISKHNLLKSIIIAVILGIGYLLFQAFLLGKLHNMNIFFTIKSLNIFIYYLFVGFGEEFMYRGYFQTRICCYIGKWKGWILCSITMALIHIPNNYLLCNQDLYWAFMNSLHLLPMSLLFGYIMMKTENLTAPAIFHTFANWATILYL